MRALPIRAAALLLCFLAVACAGLLSSRGPELQADRIQFSHAKHIEAEVECMTCHYEVYESEALGPSYRPLEEVCMECHFEERDNGNCVMCHENVQRAGPFPPRGLHLNLSHVQHIERVEEDCRVCHRDLPEPRASIPVVPPMDACLSCHEHAQDFADGRCDRCHEDLNRYALQPVTRFSHQGDWVHTHPLSARSSAETCARCHDQRFCADCHASTVAMPVEVQWPERVDRSFVHRNDWISRHPVEAEGGTLLCQRCHGESFCVDCHRTQNLTASGTDPRRPHPRGWAFPGSAVFHGTEARRDIARCAACHDEGGNSICIQCHRVGGIGGNPHPPSWLRRHDNGEIPNNGMCLFCHL